MSRADALDCLAVTAPGLEAYAAEEMRALGFLVGPPTGGGVPFQGSVLDVYRANLWLRISSRVVARLATCRARAFGELERRARQLPWERVIAHGRSVRVRASCRKSRLYHSEGVAERVAAAIEARLGSISADVAAESDEDGNEAAQLILVRMLHDECTISVDTSGELLHRRGYRLKTAKAPLRETLAAAMLAASGWDERTPLVDPLCGAGTIPIEGALRSRRIAPGARRSFAFMTWPDFDRAAWAELLDEAQAGVLPRPLAPIQGSDRDAGAVEAALGNAERAGVGADVELTRRALSAIDPPPGPGHLITNPPYGVRVGDQRALRDLYAQLGNVARRRLPGWTVALLSADERLAAQTGLVLAVATSTRNGGIPVRIVCGVVEAAAGIDRG